jgi:hypothetical protein
LRLGKYSDANHIQSGNQKAADSLLIRSCPTLRSRTAIAPRVTQLAITMSTLATTVDGLKLPNPFIIGSGPPGTNLSVISRAFREGWGAVIAKTVSLDA